MSYSHITDRKKIRKKTAKAMGLLVTDLEWRDGQLTHIKGDHPIYDVPVVEKNIPKTSTQSYSSSGGWGSW